jgi:excisionase family DNA binding protein
VSRSVEDAARPVGFLTVPEAAMWLGVTPKVVYGMIRHDRIGCEPTGERFGYRIPAAEVERLLAEEDAGRPGSPNAWLAQARALRDDAVRRHLEAIRAGVRDVIERADAVEKLLGADAGDGR